MGNQLLASKVVIVEEEPRLRSIPAIPTAVLGAVGITERGPVGKAVLCTSFEEFVESFGGFTQNSDLALAVQGYFENGGQILWVVRTVHYSDPLTPASKTSAAATLTINDRAATPVPTLKVDGKSDGAYANDIEVGHRRADERGSRASSTSRSRTTGSSSRCSRTSRWTRPRRTTSRPWSTTPTVART